MNEMLNDMLLKNGIMLNKTILIRHKDRRAKKNKSIYDLWMNRYNNSEFDTYNTIQGINLEPRLNADYWVEFIGTQEGDTLFIGIYKVLSHKILNREEKIPHMDGYSHANENHEYVLALQNELKEYIGKMTIDWRLGYRAWIQKPMNQNKKLIKK